MENIRVKIWSHINNSLDTTSCDIIGPYVRQYVFDNLWGNTPYDVDMKFIIRANIYNNFYGKYKGNNILKVT